MKAPLEPYVEAMTELLLECGKAAHFKRGTNFVPDHADALDPAVIQNLYDAAGPKRPRTPSNSLARCWTRSPCWRPWPKITPPGISPTAATPAASGSPPWSARCAPGPVGMNTAPQPEQYHDGPRRPDAQRHLGGYAVPGPRKAQLFGRVCQAPGANADTLRDTVLADFGLDENGKKVYELVGNTVTVTLAQDLTLGIYDKNAQKAVKSVPKKGAYEAKYTAAKADVAELKKNIKKVVKAWCGQLFEHFLDGKPIRLAHPHGDGAVGCVCVAEIFQRPCHQAALRPGLGAGHVPGDRFKTYTRRTNHIVALLDQRTIIGQIMRDDVTIMAQMKGTTLAQVTQYLNLAIDNGKPNITAEQRRPLPIWKVF